ncbi:TPA: hypothetical protein DEP96_00330 [Candidatus Uhrbacteria bacterium]|nr:hypothetical protein [Candidatus Uhrbacteria bacterium]
MEFDQEFVEYVAKAIVNHPEDVWAERIVDDNGVLITLHVNQEDMGHVIGGAGKTAVAIRTLLRPIAAKANMRIGFRIHDPSGRTFGEKKEGFVNHGAAGAPMTLTPVAGSAVPAPAPAPRPAYVPRQAPPVQQPIVASAADDMDTTSIGDLTF